MSTTDEQEFPEVTVPEHLADMGGEDFDAPEAEAEPEAEAAPDEQPEAEPEAEAAPEAEPEPEVAHAEGEGLPTGIRIELQKARKARAEALEETKRKDAELKTLREALAAREQPDEPTSEESDEAPELDLTKAPRIVYDDEGNAYAHPGDVARIAQQANQPDPQELERAQAKQDAEKMRQDWIAAGDAEERTEAFNQVSETYELMEHLYGDAVQRLGVQPRTFDEMAQVLEQGGVVAKIEELVPGIPDVIDLLDASLSKSPLKMSRWLDSYLESQGQATEAGEGDPQPVPTPSRPRPMNRKGSTQRAPTPKSTPEQEFDHLTAKVERGAQLSHKESKRLDELAGSL